MITRRNGLAALGQGLGLALVSNTLIGVSGGVGSTRTRSPATRAIAAQWDWYDRYLDKARTDWRAPGLAVAIVQNGAMVYAKGFGLANVEKGTRVTADTLFGVGSTTKAFTAAGIAMLVDQGKLDWAAPVRAYLPSFQLGHGDDYASTSLRDMMSHRTGLARHDLLWYNNKSMTHSDLLARLPYLDTFAPLRANYQYNNLMVMLAGHAMERVTGMTWEAYTKASILTPLGMNRSNLSLDEMARDADFANGHRLRDDITPYSIPLRPEDPIGPAGALNSSVTEFAKWIALQLGRGSANGVRLYSGPQTNHMWEPLISTGGIPSSPELTRGFYGLGWRMDTYRGMMRVAHGGNLNGFASRVTLFPEKNLGIVAFTNLGASPLPGHVTLDMVDQLLGLQAANWSTRSLARRDIATTTPASDVGPPHVMATTPSRALGAFVGRYRHKGYGDMIITTGANGLRASYNDMPMRLDHWHYDVFNATADRGEDSDLNTTKFAFQSNVEGQIGAVAAKMDENVPAIVFERVA
jgi:CubicO group peptidase (beta-lactamase class C family)